MRRPVLLAENAELHGNTWQGAYLPSIGSYFAEKLTHHPMVAQMNNQPEVAAFTMSIGHVEANQPGISPIGQSRHGCLTDDASPSGGFPSSTVICFLILQKAASLPGGHASW